MIKQFLRFFWQADTVYRVHSPFVFAFVKAVLEDRRWFYAFSRVEPVRAAMLQNYNTIEVEDYGAGSQVVKGKKRKISEIAANSLSPKHTCQRLFRIVNFLQPKTILELGTSLGISTLYMAQALNTAQVLTIEGSPAIAKLAKKNFNQLSAKNIELKVGQFESQLAGALEKLGQLDLVYLDGNHRYTPTLAYFEQCLEKAHAGTVFILDDIYWSAEMLKAWEELKAHPRVTLSIDLYFQGLLFLREDAASKQHFKLVPKRWKPWVMGFLR